MLDAIAARPQPQGFARYIDPNLLHPDLVSEVERGMRVFRKFLDDVDTLGRKDLKQEGEIVTSEFIRQVLRPHVFTVTSEHEEILWRAVTEIPAGWGSATNLTPARELFEREMGILKDGLENRYEIEIVQIKRQEAPSVGRVTHHAPAPGSWPEIEIVFLSDERVEICSGSVRKTYNYAELGFEDRRNGKPNGAWTMLRDMANNTGTIARPPAGRTRANAQKRIEEIRERLRCHFNIQTDPIPFNGNTYQATFKISRRPSFDT